MTCRMCGGEVGMVGECINSKSADGDPRMLYGCDKCHLVYFRLPPSAECRGYNVDDAERRLKDLEYRVYGSDD